MEPHLHGSAQTVKAQVILLTRYLIAHLYQNSYYVTEKNGLPFEDPYFIIENKVLHLFRLAPIFIGT